MKNTLILAFCLFFLVGCGIELIVGPIISGVVAWKGGEATKYYDNNAKLLYFAAKRVCKELEYSIERDDEVTAKGQYYLIAGENDRFKITISPTQSNISSVKIRVNFLGDKPYAELFYKHLDKQIKVIHFDKSGNPVNISE